MPFAKRRLAPLFFSSWLVGLVSSSTADAAPAVAGINMGAPVWEGVPREDELQAAIATGAPHIRVNFRVDQWASPMDTTRRGPNGGKTFFEVYDHVIDEITSRGLEVYGLLSNEIVAEGHGAEASQTWEDEFIKNSVAVVERYRDRVRVFESINEPNNFPLGTNAPFLSAQDFARLHGRLYRDVKVAHPQDACWDVSILTGPILSLEAQSEAAYLDAAIAYGRTHGAWQEVVAKTGKDPIDGVAYHLYVAQGSDSSEQDTAASFNANLDAFHAMLDARGLGATQLWISEFGFQSNHLGDQGQATRLDTAFATMSARTDIASMQWFTIADFNAEGWGLFTGGFGAANARPARASFVARAKTHAPERAARLELVDAPKQAAAGAVITVKVRATNLGKNAWQGGGNVRLGAANGCPWASATNEIGWKIGSTTDGYVNSITDARRYLPAQPGGKDAVLQGESVTIDVPLDIPSNAVGKKVRFGARMVDEFVAWFGGTASAEIEVLPPASSDAPKPPGGDETPAAGDAGAGSAGASGPFSVPARGCACEAAGDRGEDAGAPAARGALFGLCLLVLALSARKRSAKP